MSSQRRAVRRAGVLLSALLPLVGSGCFTATGVALFTNQKDSSTTDTSFPDAVPTAGETPPFATLVLSPTPVRPAGDPEGTPDREVLRVDFPPGYGEALSNRDAGRSLQVGDQLVIRINQQDSVLLGFDDPLRDTIPDDGPAVALRIQEAVRALSPGADPADPAYEPAYAQFVASFEASTGTYRFRSGAPGRVATGGVPELVSEVVFQPPPRAGRGDAPATEASEATADRLGLGEANGGIERSGSETIALTVINRGTDAIPAGTPIDLYLSHDKVLGAEDLLFDRMRVETGISVGEARRFTRVNGNRPPGQLLRGDFSASPGSYYVLWDVNASGGERVLDNNLLVSRTPVEVYPPVADPTQVEPLDFVISETSSPIAAVSGEAFNTFVSVTNLGAPVLGAAVPLQIEVVLSEDAEFDEPNTLSPGGRAGLRINPTDPQRPVRVLLDATGGTDLEVVPADLDDRIVVRFDGAGSLATVSSLVNALNAVPPGLVDAFPDGNGDPDGDLIRDLFAAVTSTSTTQLEVTARDLFVASEQVAFAASAPEVAQPLQNQSFAVQGLVPSSFAANVLPFKLRPLFRVRRLDSGALADNTLNDVRRASNATRIYDRAGAFLDTATLALLPTELDSDFDTVGEVLTLGSLHSDTLRLGRQRVLSFQIPSTGLSFDESQVLIVLRSSFDAHLDLLDASGSFLAGSDDSALGFAPVLYTPLVANEATRTFYLVVSSARFAEEDVSGVQDETFEIAIAANARQLTDLTLVSTVATDNLLRATQRRWEDDDLRVQNDVLVPFSLDNVNGREEIMFLLPQRARVRLASSPTFDVSFSAAITEFIAGEGPNPVDFQTVAVDERIVYRPRGGSISHTFEAGVYTMVFQSTQQQPDAQALRLEIETEFLPSATAE